MIYVLITPYIYINKREREKLLCDFYTAYSCPETICKMLIIYIYMNLNTVFFCDFIVHCGKLVNHLRLSFASRQLFRSNVYKSYGYVHSLFIENVGLTAFIDIVIPIKWPYFSELNDILKKICYGSLRYQLHNSPKINKSSQICIGLMPDIFHA